tara:strand:- start:8029 stop:8412 length:384 start_codon:yes stop_codon:yes gene_type:complete
VSKLISISKLSIFLKLLNQKTKKPSNHILRYWEKEFKQIKPIIINKRRYYSEKQVQLIKFIKHLLKDEGLTIDGVKNVLNTKINKLDDSKSFSLKEVYYKKNLKEKGKSILEKIKKLKNKHGKKNTY